MSSPGVKREGASGYGERQPRSATAMPSLEEIEARRGEAADGSLNLGSPSDTGREPDGGSAHLNPEDALAEATRRAQEADARARSLDEQNRALQAERDSARRELHQTSGDRVAQHEARVNADVEASKARRQAAIAKARAARDAGDTDAEFEAQADLAQAGSELAMAEERKRSFEAWKRGQGAGQQQTRQADTEQTGGDGPTAEAQKWLGDHPLYFAQTDEGREYQAEAMAAHSAAIAQRIPEGSQAYVDFIDRRLENVYGKGHGQLRRTTMNQIKDNGATRQTRQPRATSTGAPSSRDNGNLSMGSGSFEYQHPSGARLRMVEYTDNTSGETRERLEGTLPAEWRQAARVAGFRGGKERPEGGRFKDDREAEIAYALEQMRIQREASEGGTVGGLFQNISGAYK